MGHYRLLVFYLFYGSEGTLGHRFAEICFRGHHQCPLFPFKSCGHFVGTGGKSIGCSVFAIPPGGAGVRQCVGGRAKRWEGVFIRV